MGINPMGFTLAPHLSARDRSNIRNMTGYESDSELREVEAECLKRFRLKGREIQGAHPEWSERICFAKAVEQLPRTADKYGFATQLLRSRGHAALPLR